ncbi:MAG: lysophospholipid acyltransferase family protein [Coriobacteriia bacterium]|nr:lysophospholipid acyltransferase family protein [Coriobacteriia bacterium]
MSLDRSLRMRDRPVARALTRALYPAAILMFRVVFRGVFSLKVVSPERIPADGPLVIVANHDSFIDGFIVAAAFPDRRLTFLSSSYLFDLPVYGFFLRTMGALPVEKQRSNLNSLKTAIDVLKRGGTMAVFPEGEIARDEILGGAAYLAVKGNATLLPLHITGTREVLPPDKHWPSLARITVRVGEPVHASELTSATSLTKNAVAEATQTLGRVLAEVQRA